MRVLVPSFLDRKTVEKGNVGRSSLKYVKDKSYYGSETRTRSEESLPLTVEKSDNFYSLPRRGGLVQSGCCNSRLRVVQNGRKAHPLRDAKLMSPTAAGESLLVPWFASSVLVFHVV